MPIADLTPGWYAGIGTPSSQSSKVSYTNPTLGGLNYSSSFIPNYSQTPILQSIAQQAQQMAPQVYAWGMDQYNKNQGSIDTLMRNAMTYASPQRIAANMGMAESGVQQGANAGRLNALKDLQSFGIDPSAGRYAGLDQANQVMSGAAAAGAGNQQRISDIATGNTMQNQAISSSMQNMNYGFGASNAANALLGTASQLKYDPLGTASFGIGAGGGGGASAEQSSSGPSGALSPGVGMAKYQFAKGGYIPDEVSPSHGSQTDDIKANLNAGEFVIPRDVVEFKGKEFFYKLMAASRKMRAMGGGQEGGRDKPATGYADGGTVFDRQNDPVPQAYPLMPQQTHLPQAEAAMNLSPQEQALYMRHIQNTYSPMGGVDNADRSRSTLYQMGINVGGKEYNIPSVREGNIVSPDEAVRRARAEGIDKFPSYNTVDEAESRYQQMHQYMDRDMGDYFYHTGRGAR